jgi:hypothetical protein
LGTREIDNLETQATLGTRHRTTTKNTTLHRKLKSWATRISQKDRGLNTGAREGLAVPVSYKTPLCY